MAFYQEIRYCIGINPDRLGDGICDNHGKYNSPACAFDNGDCNAFNENYPKCTVEYLPWLGDGQCHLHWAGGDYNSAECGFDGGDCEEYNKYKARFCGGLSYGGDCEERIKSKYPKCNVTDPWMFGDGRCHDGGNTPECGFDGGDCNEYNKKYPNCTVEDPWRVGDGWCNGGDYNRVECGFDGGDCEDLFWRNFYSKYPNCSRVPNPWRIGNGYCDGDDEYFGELYNTTECGYDGGDCIAAEEAVFSVLFINGEQFSTDLYRKYTRNYAITQTATSIISLLSSIAIITVISRSIQKFSVPFHRLLLGLSVADICSSLAQSFSTMPAPESLGESIWNAHGNKATCQAQGFMIFVGSIGAPLYNCSLCIYYLIIVTHRKGKNADRYIKGKIEFFLHAVPILVSLLGGIIILFLDAFHPNVTYCFIGADPECDDAHDYSRSSTKAKVLFGTFSAGPYFVLPGVIVTTMLIMYREVLAQEKKLAKFGAAALKLRRKKKKMKEKEVNCNPDSSHPRGKNDTANDKKKKNNTADDEEEALTLDGARPAVSSTEESTTRDRTTTSCNRVLSILLQNLFCRPFRLLTASMRRKWKERPRCADSSSSTNGGRSNNSRRQSRAVMNKALSYSFAFFLSYLFPIIISIRTVAGIYSGPTLSVMARVFFPLQGFFNFVVFIHPKVVAAKKNSERRSEEGSGISWLGAIVTVITVKEQ